MFRPLVPILKLCVFSMDTSRRLKRFYVISSGLQALHVKLGKYLVIPSNSDLKAQETYRIVKDFEIILSKPHFTSPNTES